MRGERLLRSSREIARLLAAVREHGDPVVTELEDGELLFVAHILRVDARDGRVVTTWSPSKPANRLLLGQTRVRFHCNHSGARLEFAASRPEESEFDGRPALRFGLPRALLVLHRRAARRIAVPPHVQLRCEFQGPSGPLSAEVTDISTDGIGTIVHDGRTRLRAGTVVKCATIVHPQRGPITVGLKVRHSTRLRRPDGRVVRRVGCSFVGQAKDLEALIGLFVIDLEEQGNLA